MQGEKQIAHTGWLFKSNSYTICRHWAGPKMLRPRIHSHAQSGSSNTRETPKSCIWCNRNKLARFLQSVSFWKAPKAHSRLVLASSLYPAALWVSGTSAWKAEKWPAGVTQGQWGQDLLWQLGDIWGGCYSGLPRSAQWRKKWLPLP